MPAILLLYMLEDVNGVIIHKLAIHMEISVAFIITIKKIARQDYVIGKITHVKRESRKIEYILVKKMFLIVIATLHMRNAFIDIMKIFAHGNIINVSLFLNVLK